MERGPDRYEKPELGPLGDCQGDLTDGDLEAVAGGDQGWTTCDAGESGHVPIVE